MLTNHFTPEQRQELLAHLKTRDIQAFADTVIRIQIEKDQDVRSIRQIETSIPGLLYNEYLYTTPGINHVRLQKKWHDWNTNMGSAGNGIDAILRSYSNGGTLGNVLDAIVAQAGQN